MITLRGHHLICLIAFQGYGYSAKFAKKFRNLQKFYLGKLKLKIKIIIGADDACGACPHLVNNRCISPSDGPNAKIMALDKKAFRLLKIKSGIHKIEDIHKKLRQLNNKSIRLFCKNCSWYKQLNCPEIILKWIKSKRGEA